MHTKTHGVCNRFIPKEWCPLIHRIAFKTSKKNTHDKEYISLSIKVKSNFHIIVWNTIPYYPFLEKKSIYKILLHYERNKNKNIYILSTFFFSLKKKKTKKMRKYYLLTADVPKYRQTSDDVYHDSDVMGSRWQKRELGRAGSVNA